MVYRSTKTFGAERGLSATFRQWRAKSHCRFLHGYALGFRFTFEAETLDANNWVVDFGSFARIKVFLEDTFDHKLLIASDDPEAGHLWALADLGVDGIAQPVAVPATGCEAFAELVGRFADNWLGREGYAPRVRLVSVECFEHQGNSAIWMPNEAPEWAQRT